MPHEAWALEDTIDLDIFDPPREELAKTKPTITSATAVSVPLRFRWSAGSSGARLQPCRKLERNKASAAEGLSLSPRSES